MRKDNWECIGIIERFKWIVRGGCGHQLLAYDLVSGRQVVVGNDAFVFLGML